MLDPNGQPVVWKVTSYAGFTHITRTLEVVQANLKDLGHRGRIMDSGMGRILSNAFRR